MEKPINLIKMGMNMSTNELEFNLHVYIYGLNISNAKYFVSVHINQKYHQLYLLALFLLLQNYGKATQNAHAEAKRSLGGQSIIKQTPLNF